MFDIIIIWHIVDACFFACMVFGSCAKKGMCAYHC